VVAAIAEGRAERGEMFGLQEGPYTRSQRL
jgi:hypothetical protein